MRNFGKLTGYPETIKMGEDIKDADGNVTLEAPTATITVLKDANGIEWHELFKLYPHAFYIAIDDNKKIVSMTNDPEQSQIAGLNIIGIDSDFGETFGQGGTVYGKLWNGSRIVTPEASVPDSLSRRQFFQQATLSQIISEEDALNAIAGKIPKVMEDAIDQMPKEYQFPAKALVVGAQSFQLSNSLTPIVGKSLGLDEEQIKQFWISASKL